MTVPTAGQAAWQDYELGMFFHYDLNVFMSLKSRDWDHRNYDNWPRPELFNPQRLDTDQWLSAAQAIGAKYAVLTASHGTGFMLWQSAAYPFGVKQAPWRGGQGDVVRDFVASCRRCGIRPGLYSHCVVNGYWQVDHPGLVNRGRGGDPAQQARYAQAKLRALRDLWGNYGPLAEVWFDGGLPDPAAAGFDVLPLFKELQPDAMAFQSPAATIRWIGNEDGVANYPCWATVPSVAEAMAWEREGSRHRLLTGDAAGQTWLPGECDVTLRRNQWMWRPGDEGLIRPVAELMDIYCRSVGRNCNLLLNANPDPDGLVPEPDMQRYREFGAEIQRRFGHPLAEGSGTGNHLELRWPESTPIDRAIIMEQITEGERIREYELEALTGGGWQPLSRGQSVGHKRIEQFPVVAATALRLHIAQATAEPLIRRLAVYRA